MAEENLILRMRALGGRVTEHEVDRVRRSVDRLNASTAGTRVSLGPFSTGLKAATFAMGGFIMAAKSAVPYTLALAEGIGQAGAAAGGAGLVGLTAFGQATVVAKLGAGDLTKALGGNTAAYKKLTPEARRFYNTLFLAQARLKGTAQRGLLPGLQAGAKSALGNLPTANRIVGGTARTLGGLGQAAGGILGSKATGADLAAIGRRNTVVLSNMGRAALHAAVGVLQITRAAGPLAVSLSRSALAGSKLFESWSRNKAASGEMARFFREGKRDLALIGGITRNLTGGVLNLFGAKDVDGTNTLRNLDRLTAKFEQWTETVVGKPLGPELEKQMGIALGRFASFIGSHIGVAGVTAAGAFWRAFWSADVWGKGITVAFLATKLGLTKTVIGGLAGLLLGKGKGKGGGIGGAVTARGSSPANPLFVFVSNEFGSPLGTPVPGKAKKGAGLLRKVGKYGAFAGEIGAAAAASAAGAQAALTGKIPGWVPGLGGKSLTDPVIGGHKPNLIAANTAAYQGYRGIPTVASAMQDQQFRQLAPILITLQLDGKTIATAVHRAGTMKKSTK